MQLRSDAIKVGAARAPHRSLLKADGITDEEMGRPLIAVVNSRNDIIPGHNNLDKICEAVKAGIYLAGGVPFEVSTIGVCDGIAMNHAGMHYSLVSREVIADSLECAVEGHAFDGIVCIPNCDKIVPGMILGALRVNIPTVFVSGGPMLPGHEPGCTGGPTTDLNTLFDGAGKVAAGTMSEDELKYYEETACPTCGSCSGMFTANSMNCLCEALGIALPGNGTIPAVYSERLRLAKHAGMKVMELLERGISFRDLVSAAAIHNAMECDMAFGGSTNTVLHLTAIAQAAGHPITMDDWDAASARTPHLVKLQPSGPRPLIDLYAVGGVPVVMRELNELGLLDESPYLHGYASRVYKELHETRRWRGVPHARQPVLEGRCASRAPWQRRPRRRHREEVGCRPLDAHAHWPRPLLQFRRGGLQGNLRGRDQGGRRRRHPL